MNNLIIFIMDFFLYHDDWVSYNGIYGRMGTSRK